MSSDMNPHFNIFSFSHNDIPSPEQIKEEIDDFVEDVGHVSISGSPIEGRVNIDFDTFRPEWLKKIARKIMAEFPGGFPHDYCINAALVEVWSGSERQPMHQDGSERQPWKSWQLFIPLTDHRAQGTTIFGNGLGPPRGCRNYIFDDQTWHYGDSNRSQFIRYVLIFVIGHKDHFTGHFPVI